MNIAVQTIITKRCTIVVIPLIFVIVMWPIVDATLQKFPDCDMANIGKAISGKLVEMRIAAGKVVALKAKKSDDN